MNADRKQTFKRVEGIIEALRSWRGTATTALAEVRFLLLHLRSSASICGEFSFRITPDQQRSPT
jgi:hypothetical protein